MTSAMMKRLTTVMVLSIVSAGSCAFAGSGYDSCRQEENRLRLDEAEQCSGWGYILNPSACFNTRKALAPYTGGKCRTIAVSEGVVEEKRETAVPAAQTAKEKTAAAELSGQTTLVTETTLAALAQSSEVELLKKEVAELKVELELLKKEVMKLRGVR